MVSCCGLACADCPAYIATQNDDHVLREKTAKQWSAPGYEVPPKDVICDGCKSGGNLFKHWSETCDVRLCVNERGLKNCAFCDDYACEKLENVLGMMGETARKTLENIRGVS
jgi:hypothetical protein